MDQLMIDWINKWMHKWMDEWMDDWINQWKNTLKTEECVHIKKNDQHAKTHVHLNCKKKKHVLFFPT